MSGLVAPHIAATTSSQADSSDNTKYEHMKLNKKQNAL